MRCICEQQLVLNAPDRVVYVHTIRTEGSSIASVRSFIHGILSVFYAVVSR